jgi:hypothetical protein
MSAAMVIFTRELREKSRLFLACLGLAAVPFLATLLPSARAHRGDVIAIVGGSLAICMGLGVAMAMGSSVLSRDLAERRLSFYFTKPIGPASLWIGKAAAALLTSFFCLAVIAVPAMLFSGPAWSRRWLGEIEPVMTGALALTVFFFVSHAVCTVVRSRSPLLALDFVLLIVSVGAVLMIVWPVILGHAVRVTAVLTSSLAAAILLVLAIAPIWQLEHGRADIRRSHAAFSRFFWPGIGVVLLVAGGYVWWLLSAKPGDLTEILTVEQPARGASVLVTGTSRSRGDYHSTFLIDRATGRYERIPTPPWWGIESSQDGRRIAWLQPAGMFSVRQLELYVSGRATGILMNPASRFVLSDDGSRVAVDSGRTVTVYETASGRMLGSASGFDSGSQAVMHFVGNDVVRIVEDSPLRIVELDVRTRRRTTTGELPIDTPRRAISISGDGTRMFLRGPNLIVDGRTGAAVANVGTERFTTAAMLHDGSVAAVLPGPAPRLRLHGRDGRLLYDLPVPGEQNVWVAAEAEGGKLILTSRSGTTYVVDVARGAIERKLPGLRGPYRPSARLLRYGADQELVGRTRDGLVAWRLDGSMRPLMR